MKRIAVIAVLGLCSSVFAQFTPNEIRIQQRDAANTSFFSRVVLPTVTDGLLMYNSTTLLPELVVIGSGLSVSSGTLSATAAAQVNSDWNAVSGVAQILNKPALALVATSGAYADLSGRPSLATVATSGAYSDLSGKPSLAMVATSGAYADLSGKPTLAAIATSGSASDLATGTVSAVRLPALAISQTTGLQSALDAKFATPTGTTAQYVRGDGTLATLPAAGTGTVTSISAGAGLSGGSITTSGTISMPSVGTAGTYSGVTTDAQGRVTAGTGRSFNYTTRSLNSCFQVSSTRDALVTYSVDIATSLSLVAGQQGTVYLETFTNSGCSTGTQELTRFVNGQTGTLTIGLALQQNVTGTLTGVVPAGLYVRLRTENNTGTPTFTARPGQETLL